MRCEGQSIPSIAPRRLTAAEPEKRQKSSYLDNAKYHHAVMVQEWIKQVEARGVEFQLEFLPVYSPNLNLIERLWRFLRQHALQRWHETFASMESAVAGVLDHLETYRNELRSLLSERFRWVPERPPYVIV